ncbi:cupin domain-containing protein [Streptosporangium lutulentum]
MDIKGNTALTVLFHGTPPKLPEAAEVMTALIELPPGDPGSPPHRHSGPVYGYMLEGEMIFELEGEPERVIREGRRSGSPAATSSTTRRPTTCPARGAGSSWS